MGPPDFRAHLAGLRRLRRRLDDDRPRRYPVYPDPCRGCPRIRTAHCGPQARPVHDAPSRRGRPPRLAGAAVRRGPARWKNAAVGEQIEYGDRGTVLPARVRTLATFLKLPGVAHRALGRITPRYVRHRKASIKHPIAYRTAASCAAATRSRRLSVTSFRRLCVHTGPSRGGMVTP